MSPAPPAPADHPQPVLEWIGDSHLRIRLGDDISPASHARVRNAYTKLLDAHIPGLRDSTPAYASLLLSFDPSSLDPDGAHALVQQALASPLEPIGLMAPRTIEVPVCYDPNYAPDLADVAARCSLTPAEVSNLHSRAEYLVYFIGFTPGFPYLGGLPARLNVPRLDSPRPRVPAGSVAITGDQTGIYPHATPGGWRIIGRTPLRLFDASAEQPSLLRMGDTVRFIPITPERFRELESAAR